MSVHARHSLGETYCSLPPRVLSGFAESRSWLLAAGAIAGPAIGGHAIGDQAIGDQPADRGSEPSPIVKRSLWVTTATSGRSGANREKKETAGNG